MGILEFVKDVMHLENREVAEEICRSAVIQQVEKGEKIFREGERPEFIVLSVEGIFRGYFVDEEDREIIDCMVSQPGCSLMPGFNLEEPAPATIEALTRGRVFKISIGEMRRLIYRYPDVMKLYNRIMVQAGEYHLEKSRVISSCSAVRKYEWFQKRYPTVLNRIPDKHIASFLRMTTVTLSQVRRRLREGSQLDLDYKREGVQE